MSVRSNPRLPNKASPSTLMALGGKRAGNILECSRHQMGRGRKEAEGELAYDTAEKDYNLPVRIEGLLGLLSIPASKTIIEMAVINPPSSYYAKNYTV